MQVPTFWRSFLAVVAIGKAAVAGAGLALAILGALGVAEAITAHQWLTDFQKEYINVAALGGGVAGGIVGILHHIRCNLHRIW